MRDQNSPSPIPEEINPPSWKVVKVKGKKKAGNTSAALDRVIRINTQLSETPPCFPGYTLWATSLKLHLPSKQA